MTVDDQPIPRAHGLTPRSFLAAATALTAIHEALHTARAPQDGQDGQDCEPGHRTGSEQALAALLLLREVRDQLAEWEPGLIEEARHVIGLRNRMSPPVSVSRGRRLMAKFAHRDVFIEGLIKAGVPE